MIQTKQDQIDSAVSNLKQRYGAQVITQGNAAPMKPVAIPTGYDSLDRILSWHGFPLSGITLLSGPATCGKRTLAYKILANAQHSETNRRHVIAIFDLYSTLDADYLSNCAIDLEWLTLLRPFSAKEALNALLDIAKSRQVRAVLIDDLDAIWSERGADRYLESILPQLKPLLQNTGVILLSESHADSPSTESRFLRNIVPMFSLHVAFEHVGWINESNELHGYKTRARVLRDSRGHPGQSTVINIELPQSIMKRETW